MEQSTTELDSDWHRAQGVAAFNATWELLGAETRTAAENEEMTRRAYASAYHWDRATARIPVNAARADWLLSRVWVVQGNGELALQAADRCLATCVEHGLVDFDLAYAHEGRARALASLGRHDEAAAALLLAKAVPVADNEDRELVESDLASEPWFGLSAADESVPVSNG
jgi:tetratricopeptide (TPR) repeat protein